MFSRQTTLVSIQDFILSCSHLVLKEQIVFTILVSYGASRRKFHPHHILKKSSKLAHTQNPVGSNFEHSEHPPKKNYDIIAEETGKKMNGTKIS
uniref:Uncharacterized protein n=1 Tax=Oryzias melastigma TaxID=30732 RepID=A0A3B3CLU5_ORYME